MTKNYRVKRVSMEIYDICAESEEHALEIYGEFGEISYEKYEETIEDCTD